MVTTPDLAERDARFARVRESIRQEGLDALVIAGKGHWWSGRGYFRYLTDFHVHGMDGAILFPLEGDPFLSLTADRIARLIADIGWVTNFVGDPDVAPALVRAIEERGLAQARIGIAGQRFIMPAGIYDALTRSLPQAQFVKADHVMDRVRAIKSPLEIQQNRELWAIAKSAMERFVEVLEPGKTQWELAAETTKVVTEQGGRDILIFFNGNPPEDVPVTAEGILGYHMEIEGPSGHWCELTVTCAFRDPTPLELRLMDTELRFYEAVRRVARPGARVREIIETVERVYREDGWDLAPKQPEHNDLHGQGMDVIEWPLYGSLEQRDADVVLQEGMIFSYHPRRKVLPEVRATGINENIVITRDGAERLSAPWDLRWRVMR